MNEKIDGDVKNEILKKILQKDIEFKSVVTDCTYTDDEIEKMHDSYFFSVIYSN